jgi:hypothetical protein
VDGISYLIALVCTASVRKPLRSPRRRVRTASPRSEIKEGFRVFWNDRFLRTAVGLDSAVTFAMDALALVVIVILRDGRASPSAIGLVIGIGSVGGLAGALLATRLRARLAWSLPMLIAAPAAGAVAAASLAIVTGTAAVALAYGTFFVLWPAWRAVLTAQYLTRLDAEQRGRIEGIGGLVGSIPLVAGPMVTAVFIAAFGTRTTCVALAGVIVLVAVAAGSAPALRRLESAHA